MITYKIDGRVTEAEVHDCTYDAIRIIARRFPAIKKTFESFEELVDNIRTVDSFNLKLALMDDTYRAVVRLHEDDTYSEDVGKKRAAIKLNNKIDKEVERRIRRWVAHQHIILDYNVLNEHLKK